MHNIQTSFYDMIYCYILLLSFKSVPFGLICFNIIAFIFVSETYVSKNVLGPGCKIMLEHVMCTCISHRISYNFNFLPRILSSFLKLYLAMNFFFWWLKTGIFACVCRPCIWSPMVFVFFFPSMPSPHQPADNPLNLRVSDHKTDCRRGHMIPRSLREDVPRNTRNSSCKTPVL